MGPDDQNYTPTAITAPLGGRYQILSSLGSGSFGQTFLAADLHLPGQPQCVVKQLQPIVKTEKALQIARRLFETEANVLGQLGENEQIPRLLAHFEEKEEFYLVQELIEGHDLGAELQATEGQTGRVWTDGDAIGFLLDLLSTLSFVHTHNVIHRDIKPTNLIRRQQDQRIVLIDFGAVKQVGTQLIVDPPTGGSNADQPKPSRTIAIGTEGYMPPEQISGHPQFSSDIYATGMIAIQGLTGRYPSSLERNQSTGEIDWHHLNPQVDPALTALIDKMVRYDYRTRYDSAPTALEALKVMPSELVSPISLGALQTAPVTPVGSTVEAESINMSPTVAAGSKTPRNLDNTQTVSLSDSEQKPATKRLLIPFGIGVAIAALLGAGIVAGQQIPRWLERATDQEAIDEEAAKQELARKEAAEKEAAEKEAAEREAAEKEAREKEIAEREAAEKEIAEREAAEKEAAEREAAEEEARKREAAEREAVANIERLYAHISAKEWDQATLLFSPELAERFRPDFFEKFEQVTVENLQVTYQTDEVIDLIGQNTYTYPDSGVQIEERTYTMQLIDGAQVIVGSELVKVLQPR